MTESDLLFLTRVVFETAVLASADAANELCASGLVRRVNRHSANLYTHQRSVDPEKPSRRDWHKLVAVGRQLHDDTDDGDHMHALYRYEPTSKGKMYVAALVDSLNAQAVGKGT